jgi:outer membrane protein assembly factor BamB
LREAWNVSYGHVVWNLPQVGDGLVFLTLKKKLLAQDERTRRKAWTLPCEGAPKALWQGRLIAWAQRDEAILVEARTGRTEGGFRGLSPLRVAVVDDFLIAATVDNGPLLYAVDLQKGERAWEARPGSRENHVSCEFAVGADRVFLGLQDGTVLAFDRRTGRETWRQSVADLEWTHPADGVVHGRAKGVAAVEGDRVIFLVDARHVAAFDARDGGRAWTFAAPARTTAGCLYGSRYYITDFAGGYHVLDARTGKLLSNATLRAGLPGKLASVSNFFPVLASETHFFTGSAEGYVLAFARDSGEYVWSHRPKGAGTFQAQSSFTAANGRFYYADMSCRLYCLEASSVR